MWGVRYYRIWCVRVARYIQSSIRLVRSSFSFVFCMFFTSNCCLADMPKAKTEMNPISRFHRQKSCLLHQHKHRNILTYCIQTPHSRKSTRSAENRVVAGSTIAPLGTEPTFGREASPRKSELFCVFWVSK